MARKICHLFPEAAACLYVTSVLDKVVQLFVYPLQVSTLLSTSGCTLFLDPFPLQASVRVRRLPDLPAMVVSP